MNAADPEWSAKRRRAIEVHAAEQARRDGDRITLRALLDKRLAEAGAGSCRTSKEMGCRAEISSTPGDQSASPDGRPR